MFTRILRLSAVLCLYAVWHVATANAQFCVPPPSGIVSWWPANGDATDFFGANNGTLKGGAIANAPGEVSTAFQFDGTNGFVQIPNSAALEPTNLTVEAWVRFDSLNSSENSAPGHQYIVFKQNSRSSSFEGYDLGKHRVSGQDFFYFLVASSSSTEIEVNSTNPISTGVWYHIAGVRGSNYIQLYVNGQLQGQAAVNFPQDYGHLPLYFGSTGQSYWDGKLAGELDEVSLYNRPLSSNEIYGIYQAGSIGKCQEAPTCTPPPSGLVSWWKAEDNGNDSYNTNNGTLVGGATFAVGEVGQAFSFNGANQYVMIPNASGLNVTNQFTIDCWINYAPTDSSTPAYEGIVIADYYGIEWAPGTSGFYVFMSANSGSSYFQTSQANPGNMTFPAGQWHHLAATYDGTKLQMYLDGQAWGNPASASGNVSPMGAGDFLVLGSENRRACGCGGRNFNGLLDEVDLFNRALSASEIQAIYSTGRGGKCGGPPVVASEPQNQTVGAGSSVSFIVSAVGSQPLAYQWQLNGINISTADNPSATNSTLLLTNVQPAQSGNVYSVFVSNPYGLTNCSVTTLDVVNAHYVSANSTNSVPPFSSWATAATDIQAAVDASSDGDFILVTNGIYQTGSRLSSDDAPNRVVVTNSITVQAVNGPSVTMINGLNAMRCVYLSSSAVLAGFTLTGGNAPSGGGAYGGILNNCTLSGNSAEYGGGAYSCLANNCALNNNSAIGTTVNSPAYGGGADGCTLNNCTLSGNSASCEPNGGSSIGGGAYLSTMNNCTLSGNSAQYGGGEYYCTANNCTFSNNAANGAVGFGYGLGGGANGGLLNNCLLIGNSANGIPGAGFYYGFGGGAYLSTLNNCTLINNSATGNYSGHGTGGGAYGGTLNNCIVYYNSAPGNANYDFSAILNYCCTTPVPSSGTGNITSAPLFVNQSGGNYHLQASSPCVDAGNNSYVVNGADFDGRPRIVNRIVDIGAYEFQDPFDSWLQQYGLATNGAADFIDTDGDGMNNYQEYVAGTNPTNPASVLVMISAASTDAANGITVSWQSVNTRTYYLQRSSDLTAQPPFISVQSNLPGQPGTTSYTDTNAPAPGPYYYRVGIQH